MIGGAFVASWVSFFLFQPGTFKEMAVWSSILAVFSAGVEAFSGRGLDNLTVPLGTAWFGYFLLMRI